MTNKKKIAIFGGGIAGLTAAWELTLQPDWQDFYDVTIYQKGWRCGGKATTGLGPDGRIEERGIHMFQGWYENAFCMVQEVYGYIQLNNLNPDGAFQTWDQAFVKNPVTLMTEQRADGTWVNWPVVFPNNDLTPGTSGPVSWDVLLKEALAMFLEILIGSPYQEGPDGKVGVLNEWLQQNFFNDQGDIHAGGVAHWWEEVKEEAEKLAVKAELLVLKKLVDKIHELEESNDRSGLIETIISLGERFISWLVKSLEHLFDSNDNIRRLCEIIELGIVAVKGVFTDVYDPNTHTFNWRNINQYDFKQWLTLKGASAGCVNSAVVKFLYYGTFANNYNFQPGTIAADISIRMMLMIPSYKGCFVWNMRGGTGGSFVAPLFVALYNKGVKFEFFNELVDVAYSTSGEIENIVVGVQVDLANPSQPYWPLVKQNGVFQWTAQPDYQQINQQQAVQLIENNIDLESSWSGWTNVNTLNMIKGTDFDIAIIATSIKPIETTCASIIANDQNWANMVNGVKSTATLNVQFWLQPDDKGLGMDLGQWGMEDTQYANTVIYEDLLYSWTTMTFVGPYENFPAANTPKQISYWCGAWPVEQPLPPPGLNLFPQEQLIAMQAVAKDWMNSYMGWFWPNAVLPDGQGFNYNLLCVDNPQWSPDEKFASQWFAVNVEPSMHYVLAQPNTDQYRIKPDQTGFSNLYFAGDWTNFGLNVGYMEGTVISAIQAANAILATHFNVVDDNLKTVKGPVDNPPKAKAGN